MVLLLNTTLEFQILTRLDKRAWKRQTNYVVCNYLCRDNGKITRKKMSKLFSYDYHHYDVVKCRRNLNFEKKDTAPYTGKMKGFDYCDEYVWSTSKKILLKQCYKKQMIIQLSFV